MKYLLYFISILIFTACSTTQKTIRTEKKVDKKTKVEINPEKGIFHHDNSTMYNLLELLEKATIKHDSEMILALIDEDYKNKHSKYDTNIFLNQFFFGNSNCTNKNYTDITKIERKEIIQMGTNYKAVYTVFIENTQCETSWTIFVKKINGTKTSSIQGLDITQ